MRLFTRKPPPIACREVVEVVTAYLEGALAPAEHRRLEAHLAACEHCSAYLEQLRLTIAISGSLSAEEVPPEALDALGPPIAAWARGEEV